MTLSRRRLSLAATATCLAMLAPRLALAQGGDQAQVAQAVTALTKAMIEVDRGQLQALTHDALSYGHSAGRVENKAQFIAYLESRASAFRHIDLSDQTIAVTSDEAIVRHLFTAETVDPKGQVTPVRIGVLQVWTKDGGAWRLLARQAYRL
ncbi:nuclear transport factor 2 family protein [Paracraurococcus lichenis]|uniref:Nuclear transport factor 2 family protein n=1 Tax=Paracraurococcus lichenis TaxID=3064888 RepID=A0ABT9E5N3_9PROT|nr:nuclear transport factor 2 family protein [Paracraurococcus sp. LOR1-02]MDO9711300.1 nuclear transport factor 2 family protein [Paracraurococcus sp. LOR1-02]